MSWYLRRFGGTEPEPQRIEEGQRFHVEVGETVKKAEELERRSRALLWLAALLMITAAVIATVWIWSRW